MSDDSNGTPRRDPTGDPFDALRRPDAPIAPRPAFARELRTRLTAALRPVLPRTADPAVTTRVDCEDGRVGNDDRDRLPPREEHVDAITCGEPPTHRTRRIDRDAHRAQPVRRGARSP